MNDSKPTVLDVGQCDFDHDNISRMLSEEFGADVKRAATSEDASRAVRAGHYDLVLVNRVLDADGASGLDLIQRWLSNEDTRATQTMLVRLSTRSFHHRISTRIRRGRGRR